MLTKDFDEYNFSVDTRIKVKGTWNYIFAVNFRMRQVEDEFHEIIECEDIEEIM